MKKPLEIVINNKRKYFFFIITSINSRLHLSRQLKMS